MTKPITVFTPSYNRADLLPRLYESLRRQTCKDFLWMLIDDGSTDNTREVVQSWIENEQAFEIEYYYKENGGLHTGYNEAISHLETELAVCVDSDDWMPDDAIEKILTHWAKFGSDEYAGIIGLDCMADGKIVGDPLPDCDQVNLIDLQIGKYNVKGGDCTIVVRSKLYRDVYPMKVFPGEKNFNPHYLHTEISKAYDFLVLKDVLKYVEYQSNGMTSNMFKQYWNSPNSFIMTRKQTLNIPNLPARMVIRQSIHLTSSCWLLGNPGRALDETPHKLAAIACLPAGWLLSRVIKHNVMRNA